MHKRRGMAAILFIRFARITKRKPKEKMVCKKLNEQVKGQRLLCTVEQEDGDILQTRLWSGIVSG